MLDEETAVILAGHQEMKTAALDYAMEVVQQDHQRDDFRELLELTIIYLGGVPPRGIRIMAPRAMYQARWLAKAIYGLKVFMFRSQFNLTAETKALGLFNLFITLVYTEAWFRGPHVLEMSRVAAKAMGRHMWYPGEELVALAFFDPRVPSEIKMKMAEAIEKEVDGRPPKRPQLLDPSSLSLLDLATARSKGFFKILGAQMIWMMKVPEDWEGDSSFQAAKKAAYALVLVNDRAEREVKLIQDYNALLTKDESHFKGTPEPIPKRQQVNGDSSIHVHFFCLMPYYWAFLPIFLR